jgi:hypothetical protein
VQQVRQNLCAPAPGWSIESDADLFPVSRMVPFR